MQFQIFILFLEVSISSLQNFILHQKGQIFDIKKLDNDILVMSID